MSQILKNRDLIVDSIVKIRNIGIDNNGNYIVNDCINLVEYHTLMSIVRILNLISKEEFSYIKSLNDQYKSRYDNIESTNIFQLVSLARNNVRRITNGCYSLDYIYISKSNYKLLLEKLQLPDDIKNVKIFGSKIIINNHATNDEVYGIAIPKYNNFDIDKCIIKLTLGEENVSNQNSNRQPIPSN